MADFARYLPLSQRRAADDSRANSHWGAHIAASLTATADLLDSLRPEQWAAPSLCGRWTVRDVAGHLVWRLGSSNRELARTLSNAWVGHFWNPHRAVDVLSRGEAEALPHALTAQIRLIALERAAGRGRTGIIELSEAVVHGYDLSYPLGLHPNVLPMASGAVALRRSLIAPTEIKAVLRARTLVATDADWRIGHGPDLPGTAEAIVLFLYGRAGLPPEVDAAPPTLGE